MQMASGRVPGEFRRAALARKMNEEIRAVVKVGSSERIPFFCECGRDGCCRTVWLSLHEFADRVQGGRWIRADQGQPFAEPVATPAARGRSIQPPTRPRGLAYTR